ncbi:hypothetical protein Vadar_014569 [Vaccinium darrowii]|uniref:Uncharacterized protein n=1 Tax=Vaccinium darrowii TaxID=229202 RepID=A0ACB7YMU5_9ERIC|nr:hypothetical protein Vadar_014569 [Vaccinium darrowii]
MGLVRSANGQSATANGDCSLHRAIAQSLTASPVLLVTHGFSRSEIRKKDSLLFVNYDANHYDVLEVNHNNFDSCDDKNFIMNVTEGEDSLFNLTEAKTYYFISNRDHCLQGDLKVSITVLGTSVNTTPPPETSIGRGRGLPMVLRLSCGGGGGGGGGLMLVVSA